jgi:hypothetical protein
MSIETLPLADAALHPDWPHARFNVSGMFTHHPLLIELIDTLQQAIDCRLPVEAIHGAPAVLWNAGRPSGARPSRSAMTAAIEGLYSRNIGYLATFTNNRLASSDLNDPLGNYILDCIAKRPDLNGVIVTSDLLSNYIAEKHPALRQVASIVKVTFENGQGRSDYYRQLGQRFSRFVLHPDDCRDLELLDQLDRDKAEIIVNENCAIHCPHRARHYDAYARWQRIASGYHPVACDPFALAATQQLVDQEMEQMTAACPAPNDLACLKKQRRNCNLTRSEMKTIHDMGFRHFKLQGRGDDPILYMYDVTRFLLEPEFAGPMLFKTMFRVIAKASGPS